MQAFTAVTTTGIYCRPGCAGHPHATNVREYELAAAAEAAGFRACLRCRPYRVPQPPVHSHSELVCRAVHLIVNGALDGNTEAHLGDRLGLSDRHLRRLFQLHLGLTPDELARSRRAHFARRLLDDTDLSVTQVAFAAGFGSVRQLNRACQEIFRDTPAALRARRRRSDRLVADGGLSLRLPFNGQLEWPALLEYLSDRAIPGIESVSGGTYRRTIEIDKDPGVLELSRGGSDHLLLRAHLPHWEGLIHVVERARNIAGLDADLEAVCSALANDDVLGPMVSERRGLRVPGTWDPFETAIRAILGQQVSVGAATTMAGRLVQRLGRPVPGLAELGLSHSFPDPETVAEGNLEHIGLTGSRQRALRAFAQAVADDKVRLDRSVSLQELVASIVDIDGLGPWSAHYIALRLGEPDAFPATDRGIQRALERLLPGSTKARSISERWRPWRAFAATHLWFSGAAA